MEATGGGPRPQATSFAELTIRAMDDHDSRYDWDWVVCHHITEWEAANRAVFREGDYALKNARFAWFHCHEICTRVLAKAEADLDSAQKAIADPSNNGQLSDYGKHVVWDIVHPECERAFLKLARALRRHGLDL